MIQHLSKMLDSAGKDTRSLIAGFLSMTRETVNTFEMNPHPSAHMFQMISEQHPELPLKHLVQMFQHLKRNDLVKIVCEAVHGDSQHFMQATTKTTTLPRTLIRSSTSNASAYIMEVDSTASCATSRCSTPLVGFSTMTSSLASLEDV